MNEYVRGWFDNLIHLMLILDIMSHDLRICMVPFLINNLNFILSRTRYMKVWTTCRQTIAIAVNCSTGQYEHRFLTSCRSTWVVQSVGWHGSLRANKTGSDADAKLVQTLSALVRVEVEISGGLPILFSLSLPLLASS